MISPARPFATLRHVQKDAVQPTLFHYNSALSSCKESSDWGAALSLLTTLGAVGLGPSGLETQTRRLWEVGLTLLCDLHVWMLQSNQITNSAALTAAGRSTAWQAAVGIFSRMQLQELCQDVVSHTAALAACEPSGRWQLMLETTGSALLLLVSMPKQRLWPNTICFNATISACERSGHWELALFLLNEMDLQALQPDAVSVSAAISACGRFLPDTVTRGVIGLACDHAEQWQRSLLLSPSKGPVSKDGLQTLARRLSWSEDERAEVRAWLQPEQLKEVSPDELVLLVWCAASLGWSEENIIHRTRKKLLQCLQSRLLSWRETSRLAWSLANLEVNDALHRVLAALQDCKEAVQYAANFNKFLSETAHDHGGFDTPCIPQLTNRDSHILVFDYPATEVTKFMLDGTEEFHELSQAFFHHVAYSTSGNAMLFDLKGADPGSGDILLVDPCILRGEGEQAVKDHVKETAFEVLHRNCGQLCRAFDPHRRSAKVPGGSRMIQLKEGLDSAVARILEAAETLYEAPKVVETLESLEVPQKLGASRVSLTSPAASASSASLTLEKPDDMDPHDFSDSDETQEDDDELLKHWTLQNAEENIQALLNSIRCAKRRGEARRPLYCYSPALLLDRQPVPNLAYDLFSDKTLIHLELEDLLVISKPPHWQVDSNTDRNSEASLGDFLKGIFPVRRWPVFRDTANAKGFLHRLDVPSQMHREYLVLSHGWLPPRGLKVLSYCMLSGAVSLVAVRLVTGRMHQIRLHLSHIGHPTVTDGKYAALGLQLIVFRVYLIKTFGSLPKAFEAIDANKSGELSLAEFQAAVAQILKYCRHGEARQLFRTLTHPRTMLTWQELGITKVEWTAYRMQKALNARRLHVQSKLNAIAPLGARMRRAEMSHIQRIREYKPGSTFVFNSPLPAGWGPPPEYVPLEPPRSSQYRKRLGTPD
eukprot:g22424.t2